MNTVISVIIPAFNAELTLAHAAESILSQCDSRIEVVIVNDGSSDHTKGVAEALSKKWGNVCAISTNNRGVSSARNIGITHACGEWVMFVDSDDELKPGTTDYLLELANNEEYNLIFGMKEYVSSDRRRCYPHIELSNEGDEFSTISRIEALESLLSVKDDSLSGSCTRALYRRNWILENHISFPVDVTMGEDYCFLLECFKNAHKIGKVGYLFYRVNQNAKSVTAGYIPNMIFSILYTNERLKQIAKAFPDLDRAVEQSIANNAWLAVDNSAKKNFSEAKQTSRLIYSYADVRDAVSRTLSPDRRNKTRVSILRLGLISPILPAAVLRMKHFCEQCFNCASSRKRKPRTILP